MADQTARQRARRAALDAQARVRAKRAEQDKRRNALGLEVAAALAERDAVTAACEARAGHALAKLTEVEGLSLAAAIEWCGVDSISKREAGRLRQVVRTAAGMDPSAEQQPRTGSG